jgi:Fe-S cluster assembly scaffold protein SufB
MAKLLTEDAATTSTWRDARARAAAPAPVYDTAEPATVQVNRPPAITWHRLRMNDAAVDLPAVSAAPADAVAIELPVGVKGFEEGSGVRSGASELTHAFDDTLRTVSAAKTWETGMGPQAAAWLAGAATRRIVVEVPERVQAQGQLVVHICAADGACAIAAVDVIARVASSVNVTVQTDSPQAGSGVVGTAVRIIAEAGAQVNLTLQQTVDDSWTYLEDTGIYAADDARVDVRQVELGGAQAYMGFAADLAGYRAQCAVDTRYLGHGGGHLDFNYVMRQRGAKTRAALSANGVLADTSSKVLRGTIDLIHGCKGAVGREQETVLLTNEQARNKTIPVILCDEDDVQGDHGATIGHVNPAQLAYLQSRGLTTAQIEALFMSATFDYATAHAVNASGVRAIDRLARTVLGDGWNEHRIEDVLSTERN